MLSPDDMTAALGDIRDQVLAIMLKHEDETHGGAACIPNRASCIAYLAHCLGVRRDAWDFAKEMLAKYDAECKDRNCPHGLDGKAT